MLQHLTKDCRLLYNTWHQSHQVTRAETWIENVPQVFPLSPVHRRDVLPVRQRIQEILDCWKFG